MDYRAVYVGKHHRGTQDGRGELHASEWLGGDGEEVGRSSLETMSQNMAMKWERLLGGKECEALLSGREDRENRVPDPYNTA